MRKFLIPLLILAALGSAYAVLLHTAQPQGPRQFVAENADQAIFAATFPDLTGKPQALAQWRGKVVVLNFWATWCPPCRLEMPGFMHLQDKLGGRGLIFLGIALDDPAKVRAFATENAVNYPLFLGADDAMELSRAIGNDSGGLPFSVLLDRQGKIVAAKVGGWEERKLEALIEPLL